MLSEGTRRALSACLYDAGFTGVARLIAEGTTDVYEVDAGANDALGADGPVATLQDAIVKAIATRRAQLVLVTPDGEGEWLKPELVGVVGSIFAASMTPGTDAVPEEPWFDQATLDAARDMTPEELRRRYEGVRAGWQGFARRFSQADVDASAAAGATPNVLDIMRRTLERGR